MIPESYGAKARIIADYVFDEDNDEPESRCMASSCGECSFDIYGLCLLDPDNEINFAKLLGAIDEWYSRIVSKDIKPISPDINF